LKYNSDCYLSGFVLNPLALNLMLNRFHCIFYLLSILTLSWVPFDGLAQKSTFESKAILLKSDSIKLDHRKIFPNSILLLYNDELIHDSLYHIDASLRYLIAHKTLQNIVGSDTLQIQYRTLPGILNRNFSNRSKQEIEKSYEGIYNPFTYGGNRSEFTLFKSSGLNSSGSLSRGITIGNNQDVVVNSSFNLQLSGKITDDIEILAAITDNNIPLQPEGNTQQIQEFDKVFIQLSNRNNKLIAGDFDLNRPAGYFMNFFKKGQGAYFEHQSYFNADTQSVHMQSIASLAISKGKFTRFTIEPIEGNQGPYKLRGADNENFIIVLAGSEKVYYDGKALERGQDRDYIIDYNGAQITFTTNFLVTREKRIVVEFQYSDKNYIRTLLYGKQALRTKKWNAYVNVYSEQDSKNQPLLQELSDDQKQLLNQIGDTINNALYLNADSVGYNSDEILYAQVDTMVNAQVYTIFKYSTHPDSAFYRVSFSFLGANKGNYNQINSSANGRVYQWIAPVNGIAQGSYEPVSLLITPKRQTMITAGAQSQLSSSTNIYIEAAISHYDPNLFSASNTNFHTGFAGFTGIKHSKKLRKDWLMNINAQVEFSEKRFKPIEPYRNAEFNYDWNIRQAADTINEWISFATVQLNNKKQQVYYSLRNYLRETKYSGWMNEAGWKLQQGKLFYDSRNSYLHTKSSDAGSDFIRTYNNASYHLKIIKLGIQFDAERNALQDNEKQLQANSHQFTQWTTYLSKEDSSDVNYRMEYGQRIDYTPRTDLFIKNALSNNAFGMLSIKTNARSRLKLSARYRELQFVDDTIAAQKTEENILGRIEYQSTFWNGAVQSNTFYEAGTGLEPKQEFQYVEVAPGSGIYTWNDYNQNGVKELDEFDIAAFSDQANYIRVVIQSNDFVRIRFNSINQVLNVNPAATLKNKNSFLAKFSNQFSLRLDNKSREENIVDGLNPFQNSINDSLLLASNTQLRNTLFFNRTNSVAGADIGFQKQQNKNLQSNGIETRQNQIINSTVRWNATQVLGFQMYAETGRKQNNSEFFTQRNFDIESFSLQPKILIQSGVRFRISNEYKYQNKKNTLIENKKESEQHVVSTEFRYSVAKGGSYGLKISYYNLIFDGEDNSSLGYEMLEGLKTGNNFTWSFSSQKNISKIFQLSFLYDGRKSPGVKTIHTGGIQLRAFF